MVMLFTPHQWLALHMGGIATYFPLPLFWGLNCGFLAVFCVLHKNLAGF